MFEGVTSREEALEVLADIKGALHQRRDPLAHRSPVSEVHIDQAAEGYEIAAPR